MTVNGDPGSFGLPCRFPATPSIFAAVMTQVYDRTRFFGWGESEKFFSRIFPARQGTGEAGIARQRSAAAMLPPSNLVTSAVVLSAPHGAKGLAQRPSAVTSRVGGGRHLAQDRPDPVRLGGRRKNDGYLKAQFRRLRSRHGAKKAIGARAASILSAACHMIKHGTRYHDLGPDHVERGPKPFRPSTSSLVSTSSAMPSR